MNTITDAIMLRDTATRGQVAVAWGIAGLLVGVLFLGNK